MRKFLFFILFLSAAGLTVCLLWSRYHFDQVKTVVVEKVGEQIMGKSSQADFYSSILGFDRPHTYLVLFLNNTELRPAGGFIGSYAVIKVDRGIPQLLKVEGTEILDNTAPKFDSVPPLALRTYLGIDKWSFRDSNWNPDFAFAAKQALDLYKKENGTAASDVAAVIGFTPTVVEGALRISGPITINGEKFTADNFTEKLEYDVEYGFANRGLQFSDRKKMLADLTNTIFSQTKKNLLLHGSEYWQLLQTMLQQKQIVTYALATDWQKELVARGWSGSMNQSTGDYLLWVDANLGSLKTDAAIDRQLSYSIKNIGGKYLAEASMKYIHQGKIDWRTSRYRTYARIFVPEGSAIVKVNGVYKNAAGQSGIFDQGIENGRQWFGAFVSIEPGQEGILSFDYVLPDAVARQVVEGHYDLLLQKQIGTISPKLTLNLDFGKKLSSGEDKYSSLTNLSEDREIKLRF